MRIGGEGKLERGRLGRAEKSKLLTGICVCHRAMPLQSNLSDRSLGHCGLITPDWGLRCAEKACHGILFIYFKDCLKMDF